MDSPLLSPAEWQEAARTRLPLPTYDYFAGGARDEITLRQASAAWDAIGIRYHVLRGVGDRTTATTILGHDVAFPAVIAPMAFQRLAHPDGELATARAAARAGIGMTLSTLATTPMEEVRAAAPDAPLWFQLYVYQDRGATRALVQRAEAAGYSAIVLTVDLPVHGTRERDVRNGFTLPDDVRIGNAVANVDTLPDVHGSSLAKFITDQFEHSLTFDDLAELCDATELPVFVKGVVRGDDASEAIEHGAAGIVVSNHGGRQLDGAISTARALGEVAQAVDRRVPVLVDGGIRRGSHLLRAIALGADAAMIGRPVLWGLTVGGEEGAVRVLHQLRTEFDEALALAGCHAPDELSLDLLD
ncbi:MAG: alpha-hydroxy-acid oxidizing protein [Gemmatimonadaceae bacterium]|nr:alpha-hydroxy-acid oxidizing protein [Gemmatimonadaceae bacterium]